MGVVYRLLFTVYGGGADWQGCWSTLFLFMGVKRQLFGNSLTK